MTFAPNSLKFALLAVALGGCSTPAYRMPAGFSSSYHRYLSETSAAIVTHEGAPNVAAKAREVRPATYAAAAEPSSRTR